MSIQTPSTKEASALQLYRADGLSYAIGTSTGHILLYDIRVAKPFALKDQGYGLPVERVTWIEGWKMAGDGMSLTADKKVIKNRGSSFGKSIKLAMFFYSFLEFLFSLL